MKKKNVKKFFIIILASIIFVVLLFSIILVNNSYNTEQTSISGKILKAKNSDYTSEDNVSYTIIDEDNKYVEVSAYTGTIESLTIEETVTIQNETYTVTKIGDNAFENCTWLETCNFGDSIITIGESAFKRCTALHGLSDLNNIKTIGKEAFAGDVALPRTLDLDEVTSLGEGAFKGCTSIQSAKLHKMTEISQSAFENCTSLETCNFGDSIITIGESAFKGCTALHGLSDLNNIKTIGKEAFAGDVALPRTLDLDEVTSLGEGAFKRCTSIQSAKLHKITEISQSAFENCTSLETCDFGDSIITIGESAFKGCTALHGLSDLNNIKTIGKEAFAEDIALPRTLDLDEVTSLGEGAFKGCTSLESLDLEKVVSIGAECFNGCSNLELIRIPSTTNIPENITDNETTVIGYIYNNVTYKINNDGETVTAIDSQSSELPETVEINNKIYRVIIEKTLEKIEVTTDPTKEEYIEGENFETDGMVVTATYNDGSTKEVTNYIVTDGNNLTADKTNVTISYNEKDITKTTVCNITVVVKQLSSIAVTTLPTKKDYIEGQSFDDSGMVITATYNDGSTKEVTKYTITDEDKNNLTAGKTSITISYTENNVTKTTTCDITVEAKKEELSVDFEQYETEEDNNIKYIEKILPETSIETLKNNIITNGIIEIFSGDDKITNEEQLIATGMEIVIKFENEEERYIVVVTGDITGNGKMGIGDLSKLSRYIAKIEKDLNEAYLRATDIKRDGEYGKISDISKMSRIIAKMDEF